MFDGAEAEKHTFNDAEAEKHMLNDDRLLHLSKVW